MGLVERMVAIDTENPGIKLENAGRLLETKPPLLRMLCTAAEFDAGTEVNCEGTTKLRDGAMLLSPGSCETMLATGVVDGSAVDTENPETKLDKAGRLLDARPPLATMLLTVAMLLVGTEPTAISEPKLGETTALVI